MSSSIVTKLQGVKSARHTPDANHKHRYEIDGFVPVTEIVKFKAKEQGGDFPWQNPRMRTPNVNIAKIVGETLDEAPESFASRNRGITIIASQADLSKENERGEKQLVITTDSNEGLLDGGTTTTKIVSKLEDGWSDQSNSAFVRVRVLCGDYTDDEIVEIAEALNTSEQVRSSDLANFRGDYDKLKKVLNTTGLQVSYYDGDNSNKRDYTVVEILQLLNLFGPMDLETEDWDPSVSYRSKETCISNFCGENCKNRGLTQKQAQAEYEELFDVLPYIIEMYEFIPAELPDLYNAGGGKFGGISFVSQATGNTTKHVLPLTQKAITYTPKSGWRFPMLAALRPCLAKKSGQYYFKYDPKKVIAAIGVKLFKQVVEASRDFSGKLTQVGRQPQLYRNMAGMVETAILKNPDKFAFTKAASE
jgi:hypothetical protein